MATPSREARKQRTNQAKAERLRAARRRRQTKAIVVVLVIALLFAGSFGLIRLAGDNSSSSNAAASDPTNITTTTTSGPPAPCPATDGSQARQIDFTGAPQNCIDPAKTYTATFDTTLGKIVVALDAKTMPQTVNSFVALSRYKYYDGTQIIRSNTGIDIIQGGAPHTQTNADPGPGYTIPDEGSGFKYTDGDLVMARTSAPNSSGGQFFFGAGDKVSQLDSQGTYLKFGKATDQASLDTLHKILAAHQATDPSTDPTEGKPVPTVTVNSVTITES